MMNIPFLDLKKVNAELEHVIRDVILNVVDSGWYILGRAGEEFEEHCKSSLFGEQIGYVIGCNSGTDALVLSLLAAGIGPGDEVITVSHTAIPTICSIHAVGAKPVFVDIDENTWVMDSERVHPAITQRTKAIIPVHLYGNMADIETFKKILKQSDRDDICIIEDVAQAQGARLDGRHAGTGGRFGAFSFYPSKNIGSLGDGGAVACHTAEDMTALKSLRNYGQKDRYHAEIRRGLNSRLDEIQAAVLNVKLWHLVSWNLTKSKLMELYRIKLAGLPISFQKVTSGCDPAWHLCVIALDDNITRDALMAYLNKKGIQTLIHYPVPTHRQKAFVDLSTSNLPVTESLSTRILSLPFNTAIAEEEAEYMLDSIRLFFT
jgi:dTDP-3-amino-3,4,6-trideoxy-alpha-D-glucose transaminase